MIYHICLYVFNMDWKGLKVNKCSKQGSQVTTILNLQYTYDAHALSKAPVAQPGAVIMMYHDNFLWNILKKNQDS